MAAALEERTAALRRLIEAVAAQRHVPPNAVSLLSGEKLRLLVQKDLDVEAVLLCTTYDKLVKAGVSEGAAEVLKMLFPGPTEGDASSLSQGHWVQQGFAMMANLHYQTLGALQTMQGTLQTMQGTLQQTVVPVRIAASTCSDGKATSALWRSCGIRALPGLEDVPCCYKNLKPAPFASIPAMVWEGREDSVENMKKAQTVFTIWVDDNELLVLDVHDCRFLSFSTTTVLLEGGATDLAVVDMTLAARFLRQVDLDELRRGVFTPATLQHVAKAIYAAYECKRTSVVEQGQVRNCLPQCKVQFAALNILARVYGPGSDSRAAETTVWCGDLTPRLTMGLHSQPDMDPTGVPVRMLHVMAPALDCGPEVDALVLEAFRSSLQHTKALRRSFWGHAAVAFGSHAPDPRTAAGQSDMGAGPSASQGGPAIGSSFGQTAGAPQGVPGNSSQQPQAGGGCDDVEDVPVDYHERIEFNLELQDALLQALNKPTELQGLELTESELRAQVASVDAWGWLGAVGRKVAEALLERQAAGQVAHACDVQNSDQGF